MKTIFKAIISQAYKKIFVCAMVEFMIFPCVASRASHAESEVSTPTRQDFSLQLKNSSKIDGAHKNKSRGWPEQDLSCRNSGGLSNPNHFNFVLWHYAMLWQGLFEHRSQP